RAYTERLEERALAAERERAEEARRAVLEERARIAHELHDVVAHHVSMMVVQAEGGASVVGTSPEQAERAFDAISATGRQAMGEMRRALGVLADDEEGPQLTPAAGLDAVDALVERVRATGLAVDMQRHGPPRPLPAALDLSAYRIVQEALTNTVRHADARRATVSVRYLNDCVELEVSDDGRGGAAAGGGPNGTEGTGGHGLVGMRERVALFGGELRAGPRPEGGFSVVARLPTGP
ncbi:MAG: sensor histidine kinase, partial [Actinomycetota bacterium]|nr:sensor histidine kinase [Actinomycetota bacterium]